MPSSAPGTPGASRRTVLAAAAAVATTAVGGCLETITGGGSLAGGGSLIGGGSDAGRELTLRLLDRDGPLRDRYVVDPADTRNPVDEEAFAAALDGEAYTTTYRAPFFARDEPKYAKRDGTYYELGSVVVDEAVHTHPVVRLEIVGEADELDPVPDHLAQSELPDADQRAVQIAHMAARARDNAGGVPWDLVERGGCVYRDEDAIENSSLLDESGPSHVAYRNRIHAVEVTREQFREPVYRATVEPVAEDADTVESILRAQFVDAYLDRETLPEDARSVLLDAQRDDGYAESHPYSDAFATVLRELDERAYLDGDVENDAGVTSGERTLVRYGSRYFDYRLEFEEPDG